MEAKKRALEEEKRRREQLEKRLEEETSQRQKLIEKEVKIREKQRAQVRYIDTKWFLSARCPLDIQKRLSVFLPMVNRTAFS